MSGGNNLAGDINAGVIGSIYGSAVVRCDNVFNITINVSVVNNSTETNNAEETFRSALITALETIANAPSQTTSNQATAPPTTNDVQNPATDPASAATPASSGPLNPNAGTSATDPAAAHTHSPTLAANSAAPNGNLSSTAPVAVAAIAENVLRAPSPQSIDSNGPQPQESPLTPVVLPITSTEGADHIVSPKLDRIRTASANKPTAPTRQTAASVQSPANSPAKSSSPVGSPNNRPAATSKPPTPQSAQSPESRDVAVADAPGVVNNGAVGGCMFSHCTNYFITVKAANTAAPNGNESPTTPVAVAAIAENVLRASSPQPIDRNGRKSQESPLTPVVSPVTSKEGADHIVSPTLLNSRLQNSPKLDRIQTAIERSPSARAQNSAETQKFPNPF